MTQYDRTATCHDLRCTVVTYAYDSEEHETAPKCPACELREELRRQEERAHRYVFDSKAARDDIKAAYEQRIAHLNAGLTDLARHGTRYDLTPAVMAGGSYEWWSDYVQRMDRSVRVRAQNILEGR